jgi:hypothetical protein
MRARAICCPPCQHSSQHSPQQGTYPACHGAQAYKLVAALVEKAVGRAAPEQRLNVLYSLSAICRRSKALRGARDKYGASCARPWRGCCGLPGCHAVLAVYWFFEPQRGLTDLCSAPPERLQERVCQAACWGLLTAHTL